MNDQANISDCRAIVRILIARAGSDLQLRTRITRVLDGKASSDEMQTFAEYTRSVAEILRKQQRTARWLDGQSHFETLS